MSYCISIKEIDSERARDAGIKAVKLAELANSNFPIPSGFVVLKSALDEFLEKNNLKAQISQIVSGIDPKNASELAGASRKIREMILSAKVPENISRNIDDFYKRVNSLDDMKGLNDIAKNIISAGRTDCYVAVRPSFATASESLSFAGVHSSYVYIRGSRPVMAAVQKCWASLYSQKAMYYRAINDIPDEGMAIIIQQAMLSEKSGVASTANPIESDTNQIVIEGVWGLGEALSSGTVTPDHYVISKEDNTVEKVFLGSKEWLLCADALHGGLKKEKVSSEKADQQLLSMQELQVILGLCRKIESKFSCPQEIEWLRCRNRIYITQCRALTTLGKRHDEHQDCSNDDTLLEGLVASKGSAQGNVNMVYHFSELENLNENELVVSSIASSELSYVMGTAKGIISEKGGALSNAATLAREMEIPMIVAAEGAAQKLHAGDFVAIGLGGEICRAREHMTSEMSAGNRDYDTLRGSSVPESADALMATKIKVNINSGESPEIISCHAESDGVGMLELGGDAGQETYNPYTYSQQQYSTSPNSQFSRIAEAFYPKHVWLKTSALSSDKFTKDLESVGSLVHKGYNNIGIMIPNIHHSSFLSKVRDFAAGSNLDLTRIDFGVAIDTPAAALLSSEFASEGINFVSIDYDSIVRNILALPESVKVSEYYMHPAPLRALENCVKDYRKHKIHTSFRCASTLNPQLIEKLVECGIDSISVNSSELKMSKYVAARAEKKLLLDLIKKRDYMQ